MLVVERILDLAKYYLFLPGSSPVQDLAVLSINSTTINVSFTSPSAPNGIIDHYVMDIGNVLDMPANFTLAVDSSNTMDQIVVTTTGLCEYSGSLYLHD